VMFSKTFTESSRSLGVFAPFLNTELPPCSQVAVGLSMGGGVFCFDPFLLYRSGYLSNPNISVMGKVGRGKSAFVKSLLLRSAQYQRSFLVLDPKGEYGDFAAATAAEMLRIYPGGPERLDPFFGLQAASNCRVEMITALSEIVQAVLRRPLVATESLALEDVVDEELSQRSRPTLEHTLEVATKLEGSLRYKDEREAVISLVSALRRILYGDLSGLLGTSEKGRDIGPRAVVDLSQLAGGDLFAVVINLLMAQRLRSMRAGRIPKGFLVLDEAWAVLENPESAARFRSLFKLARSYGSSNIFVTHRLSDLASKNSNSEVAQRALSLAVDSETFVIYGQPPSEIDHVSEFLGLPTHLARKLPNMSKGVAIWSLAGRIFIVRHVLHPLEVSVVDTDQAMTEGLFRDPTGLRL